MTLLKWYHETANTQENLDIGTLQHLWALSKMSEVTVMCYLVCLNHHTYDNALGYLEYLINRSDDYLDNDVLFKRISSRQAEIMVRLINENITDITVMASQLRTSYNRSMYAVIHYIHKLITETLPSICETYPNIDKDKAFYSLGTAAIKKGLLSVSQLKKYFL